MELIAVYERLKRFEATHYFLILSCLVVLLFLLSLPAYYYDIGYWAAEDQYIDVEADQLRENLSTNYDALADEELSDLVGPLDFGSLREQEESYCGTNDCEGGPLERLERTVYGEANTRLLEASLTYLYRINMDAVNEKVLIPPKRGIYERQLRMLDGRIGSMLSSAIDQRQARCDDSRSRACFVETLQVLQGNEWDSLALRLASEAEGPDIYRDMMQRNADVADMAELPHLELAAFYANAIIGNCLEASRQLSMPVLEASWSFERKMVACLDTAITEMELQFRRGESQRIATGPGRSLDMIS